MAPAPLADAGGEEANAATVNTRVRRKKVHFILAAALCVAVSGGRSGVDSKSEGEGGGSSSEGIDRKIKGSDDRGDPPSRRRRSARE